MDIPESFKNAFLHRISLMEMMADHIEGTPDATVEGYFKWSANHLRAQRIRLLNQQDTLNKLYAENAELRQARDGWEAMRD